jgi:hypothetical protein
VDILCLMSAAEEREPKILSINHLSKTPSDASIRQQRSVLVFGGPMKRAILSAVIFFLAAATLHAQSIVGIWQGTLSITTVVIVDHIDPPTPN